MPGPICQLRGFQPLACSYLIIYTKPGSGRAQCRWETVVADTDDMEWDRWFPAKDALECFCLPGATALARYPANENGPSLANALPLKCKQSACRNVSC